MFASGSRLLTLHLKTDLVVIVNYYGPIHRWQRSDWYWYGLYSCGGLSHNPPPGPRQSLSSLHHSEQKMIVKWNLNKRTASVCHGGVCGTRRAATEIQKKIKDEGGRKKKTLLSSSAWWEHWAVSEGGFRREEDKGYAKLIKTRRCWIARL